MTVELAELLRARSGEALDLHAEYVNPQMVRVLRTIGFDRDWSRTEGAYLYDTDGERYCRVALAYARALPGTPARVCRRLEAEPDDLLRRGPVRLPGESAAVSSPGPGGAP